MTKAAIVVGGAVAKGAFAAGALSVLMRHLEEKNEEAESEADKVQVVRLVGTSSGALNAVFMAAGTHRSARLLRIRRTSRSST